MSSSNVSRGYDLVYYEKTIKELTREKQYWRGEAHKAIAANNHHREWGLKWKGKYEVVDQQLIGRNRQIEQLRLRLQRMEYHRKNKTRDLNNNKQRVSSLEYKLFQQEAINKQCKEKLKEKDEEIKKLKTQINILSGFDGINIDCFPEDFYFSGNDIAMDSNFDSGSNSKSGSIDKLDGDSDSNEKSVGDTGSNDKSDGDYNDTSDDNSDCKSNSEVFASKSVDLFHH